MNKENGLLRDPHSFSKPHEATIKHMSLNLCLDFEDCTVRGKVTYDIEHSAETIILDSKNIDVHEVYCDDTLADFTWGEKHSVYGQALIVPLVKNTKQITVEYTIPPSENSALQWLNPTQTADKKYPFLYTQGQAILTRTWIPIQDSPSIRLTYEAKVTVPSNLLPIMSASNPQTKNSDGIYTFTMNQPIPPYLIALAVGDLEFRSVSERCGVYAEKSMIDKSHHEFVDMEKMVSTAEELYGNYDWGRFDVIVLPPSFPFGGMENPCLTFATPTIIAGDRSLVSLVAHELAHSWSGNLVTNATWNDFWLNEGFTVYFERRIMEVLYGKELAEMEAYLAFQSLQNTLKELPDYDTHLKLNLVDRDPDEGMTLVAYEKGYLFLRTLEEFVGRDIFDLFVNLYFSKFRFTSITTETFLHFLKENLITPNNLDIDIEAWVYGSYLPKGHAQPFSNRFNTIDTVYKNWKNSHLTTEALIELKWTTQEIVYFIGLLDDNGVCQWLEKLDTVFNFSQSENAEILAVWLEKGITNSYSVITPYLEKFLNSVGRRKFTVHLYELLRDYNQVDLGKKIYHSARSNYHSITVSSVDKVFAV